jgi:hypothetical protein
MRYELLPETIARLERYAAEEMTCIRWWDHCQQHGIVNPTWWYANHVPPGDCPCARCKFLRTLDSLKQPAEETLGPSPEGLRAINQNCARTLGRIGQGHPAECHQRARQAQGNRGNAGALAFI